MAFGFDFHFVEDDRDGGDSGDDAGLAGDDASCGGGFFGDERNGGPVLATVEVFEDCQPDDAAEVFGYWRRPGELGEIAIHRLTAEAG